MTYLPSKDVTPVFKFLLKCNPLTVALYPETYLVVLRTTISSVQCYED